MYVYVYIENLHAKWISWHLAAHRKWVGSGAVGYSWQENSKKSWTQTKRGALVNLYISDRTVASKHTEEPMSKPPPKFFRPFTGK